MVAPPTVPVEERRRRLGRRHALVEPASTVAEAVASVVVFHASDPATVFLSALARLADPSIRAVEEALYGQRTVVRALAMRRTLFVAPVGLLDALERSSTDEVALRERQRLEQAMADSGFDDPAQWMATAATRIAEAVADGGLPARSLTTRVPMLADRLTLGAGSKWATEVGATSRVLGQLAAEGLLVRGRPSGDWTGRQYRWHLRSEWLGLRARPWPASPPLTRVDASVEVVRQWLERFGPGTIDDLKWWTGWPLSQLRPALATLDTVEVDLDGTTGLMLGDDQEPAKPVEPWVALLPSLDPTPMGWKERHWYLGPHEGPLFDRNGNIGPTIWADGKVVGGWAQRSDGSIVTRLLEDLGAEHRALVEAKAARLEAQLDGIVVKPSFKTPLQRELSGS
jgi:hypothetical protein